MSEWPELAQKAFAWYEEQSKVANGFLPSTVDGVDSKLYSWLKRVEEWHADQPKQIEPVPYAIWHEDDQPPPMPTYNPSGLPQWHHIGCFCETCEHIIARYIGTTKNFPPPTLPGLKVGVSHDLVSLLWTVHYRYGKGMYAYQWMIGVSQEALTQFPGAYLPPETIEQHSAYGNVMATYDKLSGQMKSVESGYSQSGNKLRAAVPGLGSARAVCPEGCYTPDGVGIETVIIHLNDDHRWPRAASEATEGQPNIADWLEEWALREGVDLTFKVPDEEPKEITT